MKNKITVVIPALDEEESIGLVVKEIPENLVSKIIVVDNGSVDRTKDEAERHGATVIVEPQRGYGYACIAGIRYIEKTPPSIVVFLDAGYSDPPSEMHQLVQPIITERVDLVLGSRMGREDKKSIIPFHVFAANKIFSWMINHLYGLNLTDLGPFRAIRWKVLQELNMRSRTYGWSSEMIVKAARKKCKIREVPVGYRKRIGKSKISGSIRGSLKAASHIFYTILRYYLF